jgi:hypothetical protein
MSAPLEYTVSLLLGVPTYELLGTGSSLEIMVGKKALETNITFPSCGNDIFWFKLLLL